MKRRLILFALIISPSAAGADDIAEPKRLTLSPAAELKPALQYQLLPSYLDRREGNAAPLYLKSFLLLAERRIENDTWEDIARWLETPPTELPHDEVRKVVNAQSGVLTDIGMAARRDRCDWDPAIREHGEDIWNILLPEVQYFRSVGRLIAIKARLEIAEGKHEEAIQTLQIGFAMSRHVARQPFVISGLVGVAVAEQMAEQLEELVAAKDAPNLYWAIAALPEPLIDWREHLELEGSALFVMYPELEGIEDKEMTDHQWRQLWRKMFLQMGELGEFDEIAPAGASGQAKRLAAIAFADMLVEKRYPRARKSLIQRGRAEKEVEAMAKARVTLLDEVYHFKRIRDDFFKWSHLPYWQSREGMVKAMNEMRERESGALTDKLETFSIADLLLPAVANVVERYHATDHRLAALRTIEALRLHAAGHDGKLPMTLDAIKAAPLPINPYTGQPADFEWDVEPGVAVLTLPAPQKDGTLAYELRMAK